MELAITRLVSAIVCFLLKEMTVLLKVALEIVSTMVLAISSLEIAPVLQDGKVVLVL